MTKSQTTCVVKDENPAETDHKHEKNEKPADFEAAIDAAGFGWFNIMLLLVSIFAFMSTLFKNNVMSYVIPSAECDLKLTLLEKGTLNAIVFAGMITGGLFWGYIADTKGRQKTLAFGFCLDFICVLCESMSQTVLQLQILKFLGGFILCGPFVIMLTYLAEMHCNAYRPRVITFVGVILSNAALVLAVLALFILTKLYTLNVFGLQVRSWQLFLAISGIPSLVAGVSLIFLPESPKFLMSCGENDKALKVFQLIYCINHRKPKADYPITQLVDELAQKNSNQKSNNQNNDVESAKNEKKSPFSGFKQFSPLFAKPYLRNSLLVYIMSFSLLLSTNTFRLWLPQLFASISEYHTKFPQETPTMCNVIEYIVNKTHTIISNKDNEICEAVFNIDAAYNNIYVALVGIVGFSFMTFLVSILSRRFILTTALTASFTLILSLYFVTSSTVVLIAACALGFLGILLNTLVVEWSSVLFPTMLRSMVVSLVMMFGRSGAITGNILFPVFMEVHCFVPFCMIASFYIVALIASYFLPNMVNITLS